MALPSFRVRTHAAAETETFGRALGAAIVASGVEALAIDLRGDLGAGKTLLVGAVAHGAGVAEDIRVVSPTFTIARAYVLPGPRLRELHHLDAYRLAGPDDLEAVGFEDMCGTGRLTCVEWGENVEAGLPEDRIRIELRAVSEPRAGDPAVPPTTREIECAAPGPAGRLVLAALRVRVGERA
jgi:tRNA threonylcarbamoyladenosine biosynthesis protein TsaE